MSETELEPELDELWGDLTRAVAEKSALIHAINETLYAYRRGGPSAEFFEAVHAMWATTAPHRNEETDA